MSIFRYMFPRPKKITIGSKWIFMDQFEKFKNPFDDTYLIYEVLDIKDGFVKYQCSKKNGEPHPPDSSPVRRFYAFYRKIEEVKREH